MHGTIESAAKLDALRARATSLPLEQFDPGDPELFRTDTFWPYFDRLRKRRSRALLQGQRCSGRTGR